MGSYIPAAPAEQQEMLEAIGLRDFRELYKDVPESMYKMCIRDRYWYRMSGPRESARLWAAPKGNAKALRQKNRAMTMLRKAQLSARRRCNLTAQPPGNLAGIRTEAQGIQRGTLCHFSCLAQALILPQK